MTLPTNCIGDKGQRYVLQWFGYPNADEWNDIAYCDTPPVEMPTMPPSASDSRLIDRHAPAKTYWVGAEPRYCDVSHQKIVAVMYDAYIPSLATWGILCCDAFFSLGCQTGPGRGQRYEKQEDGQWLKTEG